MTCAIVRGQLPLKCTHVIAYALFVWHWWQRRISSVVVRLRRSYHCFNSVAGRFRIGIGRAAGIVLLVVRVWWWAP